MRKNHVPLRECEEKACSLTLRNEEAEMKKIVRSLVLMGVRDSEGRGCFRRECPLLLRVYEGSIAEANSLPLTECCSL